MARPQKKHGFRPISVDGVSYFWRVEDHNKTADLEVHLASESSRRGQRLCVYFAEPIPIVDETHFIQLESFPVPVTAKIVSEIIRDALRQGWCPQHAGRDFVLKLVVTKEPSQKVIA
jgi:hypothetical protein